MSRIDLFGPVHKGIRTLLSEAGTRLGRTDFADEAGAATAAEVVHRLLGMLEEHAAHEDRWFMPELARLAPELHAALAADHARTEGLAREAGQLAARLAGASAAERAALGKRLHDRIWGLAAEHLRHMEREEAEAMRVLHAHFDDAALGAIHRALLESIPPPRRGEWTALIAGSLNLPERAGLLRGMAGEIPPAAFAQATAPIRAALGAEEWAAAAAAAGIAA